MVSDYSLHSSQTRILHSATVSEDSLRFDRYMGQDRGRMQHQHSQSDEHGLSSHSHSHSHTHSYLYPYPYPNPHPQPHFHPLTLLPPHPPQHPSYSAHVHQAILREIEKERIRQDIIMSEIIRRHGLEAEVRRELMIDRERARHGRGNGFLEKRIMEPLTQSDILNNTHEGGGSESLPFQRASTNVRTVTNAEVKPVLEGSNEKKKIILQAKPIENITGAKRDRSGSDTSASPSDGNLKKKVKEEWSCALCQVSAVSERVLNEHLEGNKHKKKEAALISQKAGENSTKNSKNKVAKSNKGSGTFNPVIDSEEVKLALKSLPYNKSGDAKSGTGDQLSMQGDLNSDTLKKGESIVHQQVQNNDKPKTTNNNYWCEICQIDVGSWKNKDSHEQGRKHKHLLKRSVSVVGPSNQMDGGAAEEKIA